MFDNLTHPKGHTKMKTENQTLYVVVKNSREYSSGQLEHLATYFDSREDAESDRDRKNEQALESAADGFGMSEQEYLERHDAPSPWIIVEQQKAAQ